MVTFCAAGIDNALCSFGPPRHLSHFADRLVADGATTRVLIAYPNDRESNERAETLGGMLMDRHVEVFRVVLPMGMDANALAAKSETPGEVLGWALRNAEWVGAGNPDSNEEELPSVPSAPATSRDTSNMPARGKNPPVPPRESKTTSLSRSPVASVLASPVAPVPTQASVDVDGDELRMELERCSWRVRGVAPSGAYSSLRCNLLVSHSDRFHIDTIDLYAARQRMAYVAVAAKELRVNEDTLKSQIGQVLLAVEMEVANQAAVAAEKGDSPVVLTDAERDEAMELLASPWLLGEVSKAIEALGIVGERDNALLAYLATLSRKLDNPLGLVIQSSSAAGKSALMNTVLSLVPPEDQVSYSAMTGQSLYYMGATDLAHKVLAVAEDEGATRASYALKLLSSEGSLSIASTGKDISTGRLVTQTYTVAGPVALVFTTTSLDVDEELMNRTVVISVAEDDEQTRAIHDAQRKAETLDGLVEKGEREETIRLHRNAQRLLEPIAVVNPYACDLSFASSSPRHRRDHAKYLRLIRTIALAHQHQREVKTAVVSGADVPYVEVAPCDIEIANHLLAHVMGRSLGDIPPVTRSVLFALDRWTKSAEVGSFTRREAREALGLGDTQLKIHLARLVDMELLRASRNQGRFTYDLAWSGEGTDGERFVPGLSAPPGAGPAVWPGRSGQQAPSAGGGRASVGPVSATSRETGEGAKTDVRDGFDADDLEMSDSRRAGEAELAEAVVTAGGIA